MTKTFTIIPGVILVLIGLLGFTSNSLIGTNALFASDTTHNFIHIILGLILLAVVFWYKQNTITCLKIIGTLLFIIGVIGVFTVPSIGGNLIGMVYTNGASNWFHLIAGIVLFVVGRFR